MKGHPDVLDRLGELLTADLTAADLYLVFSRRMRRQGYPALDTRLAHEAAHERHHAQLLLERILLLEGTPDVLSRLTVDPVPSDPRGVLQTSLDYELDVARRLNEAVEVCVRHRDAGSRRLLEQLLRDTEDDHVDWLETQLHLIEEIGLEEYLAQQHEADG